jgi:lipoprotein-anchoring transpeptidase ErfK/SrfK
MKRAVLSTALLLTIAAGGEAQAQYGGGFIELLMTGREPTPHVRPLRPDPLATAPLSGRERYPARHEPYDGYEAPYGERGLGAPIYGEPPRRARVAALPGAPEAGDAIGIRRVVPAQFNRQIVDYDGPHRPGTIVIDTPRKFLYLVQQDGTAIRYGIGVGRPGFEWAGVKSVTMKREWPDWRPPAEMLKRRPDLPRYMAGGPDNPLGARALYLGSTLYRIHGTNEPWTIGQAVSSGCIRMMNEDVVDLYNRARVGTKVIVI